MTKPMNQKDVLKKVLLRIRPYRAGVAASLILAVVYVVMTLYIPILVGNTISGALRLTESLLWAGALASGFMLAIWITGV